MKILFINNFFSEYGGTETVMYEQAVKLREKGHEVLFFATDKKPFLEKEYEFSSYFPKFTNYRSKKVLLNIFNIIKPFYNFEAQRKLNKFLKVTKPDVIHCHNIYYHLTPSILKVCKKNNIPVVMTINDTRLICPAGTLLQEGKIYCDEELCSSYKNPFYCVLYECKNGKFLQSLIVAVEAYFVKKFKFYNAVSAFVCPSMALLELAKRSGFEKKKLRLLHNFIPDSYILNKHIYTQQDYFLYAGRISEEKGVNDLILAFEKLPDIPLRIAGSGPEEIELRLYCEQKQLKNIQFIGSLNKEELTEQYQNCIALLQPSVWFETFGMSILEAFACGKPVIANDRGAISELVERRVTGLLLHSHNTDLLEQYIRLLWNDKEFARQMGRNARKKAENYSSENHINNLLEIYESVIKAETFFN
ncbi:MAG: glycosyltransferase [bacterium]